MWRRIRCSGLPTTIRWSSDACFLSCDFVPVVLRRRGEEVDGGQVGENWGLDRGARIGQVGWRLKKKKQQEARQPHDSIMPSAPICQGRCGAARVLGPAMVASNLDSPARFGPGQAGSLGTIAPRRLPRLVPACKLDTPTRCRAASQGVSIWKSETRHRLDQAGRYLSRRFTDGRTDGRGSQVGRSSAGEPILAVTEHTRRLAGPPTGPWISLHLRPREFQAWQPAPPLPETPGMIPQQRRRGCSFPEKR